MKRFKEIAAILLLHCWPWGSRRRLWHRRAVVVARGILISIFTVTTFLQTTTPDSLQLPPPHGEYCWH